MKMSVQPEDEGIVINFGETEEYEGGGMPDIIAMDEVSQPEQQPSVTTPTPAQPSDNDLIVQEDEESLELAKQIEEEEKRKAEEAELLRKQQEAEAQAEAERIAREKALAEQKAREEEAIKKAQAAVAMFGQAGSNEGANAENATDSPSNTNKGNPVGKNFGQVDGNILSLPGRALLGDMPKPSNDFKEQGKVVVNITVDKSGNVVGVSVGDGTTISDRYTQQLALDAARKAKFTEGETPQRGTIIYNFKLN
jgi:TonB family protein